MWANTSLLLAVGGPRSVGWQVEQRAAQRKVLTADAVGAVPLGQRSSANFCDCVQFWA